MVGVLPLVLGLAGAIRPLSGLVFAGIFVLVGAVQAALVQHELTGLRRKADGELRRDRDRYLVSALAAWRSDELTSAAHRTKLARSVARTARDLSPARLPGASPLNRVAARPHVELLHELARRLEKLDRPVDASGVLKVQQLLTSPDSPLYAREGSDRVRAAILECLYALSPNGGAS